VSRPRLLDLFCGAGGAAMGYHRAGFDVVGVDINPQPNYPFEFHQADAMTYPLDGFDVIHASPPCQRYTTLAKQSGKQCSYLDLVKPVRERLKRACVPYVIENVPGAPLENSAMLCGTMFPELKVIRHRCFESSTNLTIPLAHLAHPRVFTFDKRRPQVDRASAFVLVTGWNFRLQDGKDAMGVDWMQTRREVSESIPPAYTEFIGKQLIQAIQREVAA